MLRSLSICTHAMLSLPLKTALKLQLTQNEYWLYTSATWTWILTPLALGWFLICIWVQFQALLLTFQDLKVLEVLYGAVFSHQVSTSPLHTWQEDLLPVSSHPHPPFLQSVWGWGSHAILAWCPWPFERASTHIPSGLGVLWILKKLSDSNLNYGCCRLQLSTCSDLWFDYLCLICFYCGHFILCTDGNGKPRRASLQQG